MHHMYKLNFKGKALICAIEAQTKKSACCKNLISVLWFYHIFEMQYEKYEGYKKPIPIKICPLLFLSSPRAV